MTEILSEEREMAPKRQRMMEMVLALGGLREETAIPIGRVNEELEALRNAITPLIDDLLSFPDDYFEELVEFAQKNNLIQQVTDRAVLKEVLTNLEQSTATFPSNSLSTLRELVTAQLKVLTKQEAKTETREEVGDIGSLLLEIPRLTDTLEGTIVEFEENAKRTSDASMAELRDIVTKLRSLLPGLEKGSEQVLDELQNIGSKTRYGPFLRLAAQLKRGKREGRVTDEEFCKLVRHNALMELYRGIILFILNNIGARTVVGLAELMDIQPRTVQSVIPTMIQRGEVEIVGTEHNAPIFARVLATPPQATTVLKQIIQQLKSISKSLQGESLETARRNVNRLESLYERLQILGAYEEVRVAEPLTAIRKIVDSAAQAIFSMSSSKGREEVSSLIAAGLEAFTRFRLKIALEKGPKLVTGTNVYGEKMDPIIYERMMDKYLENEIERGIILVLIREQGPMTAKDIVERTRIPSNRVFSHLLRMKRDELLTVVGEAHGYVVYDVPRTPNEAEVALKTVSSIAVQMATFQREIRQLVQQLKAEDIGRLTTTLETFSRAHDKLMKMRVGGIVIGEQTLNRVEKTIKTAVAMAYKTRSKIPSTRSRVTIEDLMEVDVPTVMDEYRHMMGYAPLIGFGTIKWDYSKCLGCRSCELACPEHAISLKPLMKIPDLFEMSEETISQLPTNKSLLYRTIRTLATRRPTTEISLRQATPGFGRVEVDLWLCVACKTCVRRCPGPQNGALELELKWNLPEIVRFMTTRPSTEK